MENRSVLNVYLHRDSRNQDWTKRLNDILCSDLRPVAEDRIMEEGYGSYFWDQEVPIPVICYLDEYSRMF